MGKMSREQIHRMLSATVAGVIATGAWLPNAESAMPKEGEPYCSPGAKGQSSCGGFGNENGCHGLNSCAGKGWVDMSKEECLKNKHIWKEGGKKESTPKKS